jgi:DNA-binding MarR family transcriptional regulator
MDLVDRLSPYGFDCVCGNLRMAARAVSSVYDRHLAASGLQASQLAVLWAVSNAQGITVKQLAECIAMHETTLIRNLRVLERQGWVALKVGRTDRRQRIPSLTRAGRTVFGKALIGWKKAQSEISGLLAEGVGETNRKLLGLTRAAWQA